MITIKCPRCQTDNLYDAEFCRHCGLRLAKDCPKCSANNPHQFTYCSQCGHSLAIFVEPVLVTKEQSELEAEEEKSGVVPKEGEEVKEEAEVETAEKIELDIKMPYRVSTGIAGLDPLIGGGFLSGKVYLVSGESGAGKTVFGLQYLYDGLIRAENGIYVSGDEKPSHIIVDAESLGWDFRKYVEERKLGLLDISPHFAEIRASKANEVDVRAVVTDLIRLVKDIGAKRIVIDNVAPLVFGHESLTYIQEYVRHLVFAIEGNLECTALMTSGIPSGSNFLSRYGVEEFLAEGVIVLDMLRFNGYCVRTLSVRKMRCTAVDPCNHIFEILPQRGIVIKH
jgi:circadian clock protein KaiC